MSNMLTLMKGCDMNNICSTVFDHLEEILVEIMYKNDILCHIYNWLHYVCTFDHILMALDIVL